MIQFARGTSSVAASSNSILSAGQPFFETDTNKLKIGNGTASYNDLPYIGGSGGKNYATVVVGTSTAGYTADQVDFLCDGTDDQVEINAAIQSLPASNSSYGVVLLLGGTYFTSDTITLNKSWMTFIGQGEITNIRKSGSGDILSVEDTCITIKNMYLQHTSTSSGEGSTCINISSSGSDCKIDSVHAYGADINILSGASNTSVLYCDLESRGTNDVNASRAGLYIYKTTFVTSTSANGSNVNITTGGASISDCFFSGSGTQNYAAVYVNSTGSNQVGFKFNNCQINSKSTYVVELHNCSYSTLTNNSSMISWPPSEGWFYLNNCSNSVVSNNALAGANGLRFLTILDSNYVVVSNNSITALAGGSFLSADSRSSVGSIVGNCVNTNSGNDSLSISGERWTITGNSFLGITSLDSVSSTTVSGYNSFGNQVLP